MSVRDWVLDFGHRLYLVKESAYLDDYGLELRVVDVEKWTRYRGKLAARMLMLLFWATLWLFFLVWYGVSIIG